MSDLLTRVRVYGKAHNRHGYMVWGRVSREKAIAEAKRYAQSQLEKAQDILNTPDDEFDVAIIRGPRKQKLVEQI